MRTKTGLARIAAFLVFCWPISAAAQDPPPSAVLQKELVDLVERLQRRIDTLEERLAEIEEKAAPSEDVTVDVPGDEKLEERIEKLEQSVAESEERSRDEFRATWENGLHFETADQRYKLQIGGRIQVDAAFFRQSGSLEPVFDNLQDSVEFRRVRLFVKGEIFDRLEYKLQLDFADGVVSLNDVYIAFGDVRGIGNIRLGHFKEPMSLEEQTSSKYTSFMERSLINALVPGRNMGIMFHDHALDKRLTWAIGLFRDSDNQGDGDITGLDGTSIGDGRYNVTARITGLPFYAQDGRRLIHLGGSYSYRNPEFIGFRSRPEVHLSSERFVDTGTFPVNSAQTYSGELAFVGGPFSMQAEYQRTSVDTNVIFLGNHDFAGFYVSASWFVTGEHRRYSLTKGAFDRVVPKRRFRGVDRGPGAVEVAGRFSKLDLSNGLLAGGEEENLSIGINWYLNSNLRLMWNWVHAEIDDGLIDGDLDVLQTRLQIEF